MALADNTPWGSLYFDVQMMWKLNSLIVLLFIQFKIGLIPSTKTSLPLSMLRLSSIVHVFLSPSLGDKGLFRSSNILQIADVICRVFFLLFLPWFKVIVRLFLPCETSEMFCHFVVTTKTTQPCPQVFSVNGSVIWQFCYTFVVIFHILQNSP